MICTGIVAFFILISIERGALKRIISFVMKYIPRTLTDPNMGEVGDDDVAAEKLRVDSMTENELKSETLTMQDVSKFYGRFLAVNQISFGVKRWVFCVFYPLRMDLSEFFLHDFDIIL